MILFLRHKLPGNRTKRPTTGMTNPITRSFEELGETVRTANADNSTEAEQRQAAVTLARIEGTNLYDAVVENINGGLAKVAELLGRNEAELAAAAPAGTGNTSGEYEAFDMNEYL